MCSPFKKRQQMNRIILLIVASLCLVLSTQAEKRNYDFVVAADGSGDYTTIQATVNAVPDYRKAGPTRILVRKGIYKEKVVIAQSKEKVQLIGEDGAVITYDDYASKPNIFGEGKGTSGSGSIYIFGPDFLAENITFENSSGPVGQAVACHVGADRAVFRRCRFLGFQDTLYTFGEDTREYYEDCYIEGTVDFIFGKASAVFNRCELHSLGAGYLTAPATPKDCKYGYVFYDCKLTAAPDVKDGSRQCSSAVRWAAIYILKAGTTGARPAMSRLHIMRNTIAMATEPTPLVVPPGPISSRTSETTTSMRF